VRLTRVRAASRYFAFGDHKVAPTPRVEFPHDVENASVGTN